MPQRPLIAGPARFWGWFDKNVKYVFIALTAIAALTLVYIAFTPAAPVTGSPRPIPTFGAADVEQTTLGDKLKSEEPVNIVVIGDSTGYEQVQWVYTFARDVGGEGRPVQVALWNRDTLAYDAFAPVSEGTGAPVQIWNGSAPSEAPRYSQENLGALIPQGETVDAIVVNHGFNTAADGVTDISRLTGDITAANPGVPLIFTIQNPRANATPEEQAAKSDGQKAWAARNPGWTVVDVYTAFTSHPDMLSLYRDDRHPNEAGGRVWADTFKAAIGY